VAAKLTFLMAGCNLFFFEVVIAIRTRFREIKKEHLTKNYKVMGGKELIPIVLFIGSFSLVFGIRYLINKEKMAMIERGIDPGLRKATPKPFISLKFGLLLVGLGLGLLVALFTVRGVFGSEMKDAEQGQAVAIYFGSIFIFGGLGLITSYVIEKKWLDQQP